MALSGSRDLLALEMRNAFHIVQRYLRLQSVSKIWNKPLLNANFSRKGGYQGLFCPNRVPKVPAQSFGFNESPNENASGGVAFQIRRISAEISKVSAVRGADLGLVQTVRGSRIPALKVVNSGNQAVDEDYDHVADGTHVNEGCSAEPGKLVIEKIEIVVAGKTFTIVQPADMDEVLDMYIAQDRLDRDPYWCRLWPSALAMVEEITRRPELVRGLSVCDLGAGLGLGGLAAALAGAREVVLYDREPLALACALMTARANGVDVGPFGAFHESLPFSDSLLTSLWSLSEPEAKTPEERNRGGGAEGTDDRNRKVGAEGAEERIGSGGAEGAAVRGAEQRPSVLRAELFDWSDENRSKALFDVVLACDVLYEKLSVPAVAAILPSLLKDGELSCAIVTDPTERCPANRTRFVQLLEGLEEGQPPPLRKLAIRESSRSRPFMDGEKHNVEVLHVA